jgi:type II secretory pathway pseudopilin PulG
LYQQAGFTYLAALLLVAIMGAVLGATATVWHTMNRRDKEQDLLFIGHEFRKAIRLYYDRSPGGARQYPKTLEDLLLDKRQTGVVRYLRRVYADPLTGKKEWGIVKGPGDTIMGVYSLAEGAPIKTGGFDESDKEFEGKSSYAEWQFVHQAAQSTAAPRPPGVPPAPGAPPVGPNSEAPPAAPPGAAVPAASPAAPATPPPATPEP